MSHRHKHHRHHSGVGAMLLNVAASLVIEKIKNRKANPYPPDDQHRTDNSKVGYRNGRKVR